IREFVDFARFRIAAHHRVPCALVVVHCDLQISTLIGAAAALRTAASGCIAVEDKVARLDNIVAGEAGAGNRFGCGRARGELRKSAAAGGGVFLGILTMNWTPFLGGPATKDCAWPKASLLSANGS